MWFVLLEFNIFLLNVYVILYFIPLHVLGYGFCISSLNFKFYSFYSWFILRFLCSTKIVSHFLRKFFVERDFLLFVKRTAHSLILSRVRARKVCEMKRERVREHSPETLSRAHVDPKGWKISLSNYRTKIFLYFIFVLVGVSGKRREGEGGNK